jgi:hypothetical protein
MGPGVGGSPRTAFPESEPQPGVDGAVEIAPE